jgi:SAM-dependent methyltransferase
VAAGAAALRHRYANNRVDRVGYATVRDFADSRQHLPHLAQLTTDLKDVQRPWTLKAVLASVRWGGSVLEIGAGEPSVASALVDTGCRVWVVDPYDGRDRGPSDFRAISERFPQVRFLRGTFPDALPPRLSAAFDCIYSISVLEHLSLEQIEVVCRAIERLLVPGGVTIHAVDHVLVGAGAEEHRAKLGALGRGLGLSAGELEEALARIDDDAEAYFLSAEAHELWRGSTPYDEFPMRRCVSIQFRVERSRRPAAVLTAA